VLAAVGGWSRALAAALRGAVFEPETRVTALEPAAAGGVVARSEDGREWRADGAVIATGPRTAHALLAPLVAAGDQLLGWLASVKLRPTWTLALAVDVALERDVFGVFHDVHRARAVSACAVHGAKMAAPPHDRDVVLAWPTPDVASRMRESASEHIVSAMLPDVEDLIPAVRGHVTRARVYRFDEGTPLAHPGFAADRTRARALAVALPLPIALAGDYLATPLIEGAVASGEGAAHTLAERLTRR
jgi:predicted NAD/FAD-dependent oxidoreductase